MNKTTTNIREFDEDSYLSDNPDVAAAVESGLFTCGYEHFVLHGYNQGRIVQTTKQPIAVSVVVPCYNTERFLSATLLSVKLQSLQNWECLIIDDGSDDLSLAIAAQFASNDQRFRIIKHRHNGGLSAARNTGIRSARGTFITFLDSDDVMFQDSLRSRLNTIRACDTESIAGSYCASIHVAEDYADFPNSRVSRNQATLDFLSTEGGCPFTANQPMFRSEILRKFGGFREELNQSEDWELWARILRHGYSIVPSGHVSVGYRARSGSMIHRDPTQHLTNSFQIYTAAHEDFPQSWNVGGPGVFDKPWIHYRKQIRFANRLISSAGIAPESARDSMTALMNKATPNLKSVLLKHVDVQTVISKSLTRSLGIVGGDLTGLTPEIRTKLVEVLGSVPDDPPPQSDGKAIVSEDNIYQHLDLSPLDESEVDVLFAPHSAYHVHHMEVVAKGLEAKGIKCCFVDSTSEYRDQGVRRELKALNRIYISYSRFVLGRFKPKALVCMCDWDVPVRRIVKAANHLGIPTVGLVEGVQDYDDADTGRSRRAYRTVRHVLLPGQFDRKYFSPGGPEVHVVGLARLDSLRKRMHKPPQKKRAVINVNFTYNVLEDKREEWLESAVSSCEALGIDYVISQHPADRANLQMYKTSPDSIYDLLEEGSVLISRFSSVILEALVIGVPCIYHNPIDERVDKFLEPQGAYFSTTDDVGLRKALQEAVVMDAKQVADAAAEFLNRHCNFGSKLPATDATVDAIATVVASSTLGHDAMALGNLIAIADFNAPYNEVEVKKLTLSEVETKSAKVLIMREVGRLLKAQHAGTTDSALMAAIQTNNPTAQNAPKERTVGAALLSTGQVVGQVNRSQVAEKVVLPVWKGFSEESFISFPTYEGGGHGPGLFFSAWAKFADTGKHQCVISSVTGELSAPHFMVRRHGNGKLQFLVCDGEVTEYVWHELPPNAWYWIAGMRTGNRLELWIDGTLVKQATTRLSTGPHGYSSSFRVGIHLAEDGSARDPMLGSIAGLHLEGRQLQREELLQAYAHDCVLNPLKFSQGLS